MVFEEIYELLWQMYMYMEMEGGVVVFEVNGGFMMYVGMQYGYKDCFQFVCIFDIFEEKIRVVLSLMGGFFGGKDELNIQLYVVFLVLKSGFFVKIYQIRKEFVCFGIKCYLMKIMIKMGVDYVGKFLVNDVKIVVDIGVYVIFGLVVFDFFVEYVVGLYCILNIWMEGIFVFMNNGVVGEFRGFGGN